MTTPSDLPVRAVQVFSSKETADTYQFAVTVPPIDPAGKSVAFLAIHSLVTSTKTDDYAAVATAPGLEWEVAAAHSHTTANRRFVGVMLYALNPVEGSLTITIQTSRKVNSIAAVFCIVDGVDQDNPLLDSGGTAGNGDGIELVVTPQANGLFLYSVQSRRGNSNIQPRGAGNVLLKQVTADPDDNQREVSAALMASAVAEATEGGTLLAAAATPSPSGLNLLLAAQVRLFVEEPDEPGEPPDEPGEPPVPRHRELMIIVRDIPAGDTFEVRFVKPGAFVYDENGYIDWDGTPYTGFVMMSQAEPEEEPEPAV